MLYHLDVLKKRARTPPDPSSAPFNPLFWTVLFASWTVIAFLHSRKTYPDGGPSFWLAFVSVELRALLAMASAVLFGGILKRPLGRFGEFLPPAALLILTALHQAAALTFFFLGQPLAAVLRYLSSGKRMGPWAMLTNTGMSDRALIALMTGAAAIIALGLAFLVFSQRQAARRNRRIRTTALTGFCCGAVLLIFMEQVLSRRIKNPSAWHQEQLTSPLYVPLLSPHGFAEYTAKFSPPRQVPEDARVPDAHVTAPKDALAILIILESFRSDCIDPETAPNLYRFQRENLSFSRAFANGNATALAWPAIVDAAYPTVPLQGSPALALLQKAGFRNSAFISKVLESFPFRYGAFGRDDRLAKLFVGPGIYDPQSDILSTQRLLQDIAAQRSGGRNFRILFLNASHSPYHWPANFKAKYQPVLSLGKEDHGAVLDENHATFDVGNADAVNRFRNRYKNSVNFVDSLFGSIVSDLKARNLYKKAVIVVVGDHGQEFLEHGVLAHGTNLFNPQIHIPLIMKLPGRRGGSTGALASQVDIMPTLLDYFGLEREARSFLVGRSLLRGEGADRAVLTKNVIALNPKFEYWALSAGKYKIEFALSGTAEDRPLIVWRVSDEEDKPYVPGKGSPADYRAFLDREFVPRLNRSGLISIVGT